MHSAYSTAPANLVLLFYNDVYRIRYTVNIDVPLITTKKQRNKDISNINVLEVKKKRRREKRKKYLQREKENKKLN